MHDSRGEAAVTSGRIRLVQLLAALWLLDASVTFYDLWPTPLVRWTGHLSVELALALLVLGALTALRRQATRRAAGLLGALWVLLFIGRYAAITAPSLYGRDINLYWDVRHLSSVAGMLAQAASPWLVVLVAAVLIGVPVLLYIPMRWAFGRIGDAMSVQGTRRILTMVAGAVVALFAGQRMVGESFSFPPFATPVTSVYATQARLLARAVAASHGGGQLPASPDLSSDLSRVSGADVLLLFVESYGAVSWESADFADPLAAARASFESAIRDTGRQVVSAYVESPTFGGLSWLAHVSLMSGVEVRDEDTNDLLMTQHRPTIVSTFRQRGYRTIAFMPGLKADWPEGAYYGFDDVYGAARLDYRGPQFGWWAIPDQYTVARLDQVEIGPQPRKPLFVFMPTITTHVPFVPMPPYQPDWNRVLSARPFDAAVAQLALDEEPDWFKLAPAYIRSLDYIYETLGTYLRMRAGRDFVIVMLGDHQPMAMVSGEGRNWNVPVHVIASRPELLARLEQRGFRAGLRPEAPAISKMHELLPTLIDAFGDTVAAVPAAAPVRSIR